MRMNRKNLYDMVSLSCDGEYAIGIHGISEEALERNYIQDSPTGATNDIMKNGLKIKSARSINGTVRFFGRIDLEKDKQSILEGLNDYSYLNSENYIIVAVPTIFRNRNGEELYLGCPNLESEFQQYMGTTGREKTTLLDSVILDNSTLSPAYILGSFRIIDSEGNINLALNPYHISCSNGIVSDEEFERIQSWMYYYLRLLSKRIINDSIENLYGLFSGPLGVEDMGYLENILDEIKINLNESNGFSREFASIAETIKQLINEKRITKSR